MWNPKIQERSFGQIDIDDLKRLYDLARRDREDLFSRYSAYQEAYADRVICVALCQGAAQHYIDGKTGIKDFDVWTFYRTNPKKRWCYRRLKSCDFGDPKFGQSMDRPDFVGRRVDLLGRAIAASREEHPRTALQRYLREPKTDTAFRLAKKAVVLLYPDCGTVIWPNMGALEK